MSQVGILTKLEQDAQHYYLKGRRFTDEDGNVRSPSNEKHLDIDEQVKLYLMEYKGFSEAESHRAMEDINRNKKISLRIMSRSNDYGI